jgi:predicted DNA-binding transcriptional regulator AlpA
MSAYSCGRLAVPVRAGSLSETGLGVKMTNELMTVGDFLSRYAISRTEFYRQVKAQRIPLRKLGNASRVARSDAEAWVASLPLKGGAPNA